ncbi:MAG: ribonuclease HI family protein [Chloroflexi bacterium]|nr:ribonuclease HI family protein [Chloroflexota bacterium]
MKNYTIVFDGGSKGNPGEAFGSFLIVEEQGQLRTPVRLQLGYATNNEAEYLSLLSALETLLEELKGRKTKPKSAALKIYGDSQLVINQVNGDWKAKSSKMRSYRDKIIRYLIRFYNVESIHQSRKKTVKILGH